MQGISLRYTLIVFTNRREIHWKPTHGGFFTQQSTSSKLLRHQYLSPQLNSKFIVLIASLSSVILVSGCRQDKTGEDFTITLRLSHVFNVNEETGIIHSEMNSPGIQMAYANRLFLKMVHESGKLGRVAMKPTQAMEDGINAGLHSWLLQGTKFEVGRKYAVDGYVEHKEAVDRIIALLPKDFKAGMENWGGKIEQHISDTNFGLLLFAA